MGSIVSLKRFEIHDGDGIRTTLFLKGCPLKCVWCHNPECIDKKPVLSYNEQNCINCMQCTDICDCHVNEDGRHLFRRENCKACGKCEKVCLGGALKLYGTEISADDIMPLLLEDQAFYKNSGGGVTISGGEPLMQSQFCAEILKRLKSCGINTAVDTCGFAARADFDRVVPFTDTFLYDLKAYDEQAHIRCTGKSNRIILENLKYLDEKGKKIEVRIPYIPGLTSGEILNLGLFLKDIKSVNKVRLLAYHCAESKYRAIGLSYTPLDLKRPSEGEMLEAAKALRRIGLNAVYGAD